ncbi:hypothetical protein [Elongatibacter sediminis]
MIRDTSAGLPEPDTRSGSAWRVLALVLMLAAASAMAQAPAPENERESVTVSDAAAEDAGDVDGAGSAGNTGDRGSGMPDGEDAGSEDEALVIEPAESFDPTEEVDEDYSIPFPVDI